jgi:ABC-type Fe3+/spermidine/putrescine transport system ATPase subunit
VALARAIVKEAIVLLLDEPLSNLDAKLREQMRRELKTMQTQIGTTAIYVTHDQEEALTMSDRIALMRGGKIVELGTPTQLYLTPKSPFTARFLGQANLYACSACDREGRRVRGSTPLGALVSSNTVDDPKHVRWMMVRPEHVEIDAAGSDIPNRLSGQIRSVTFTGRLVEYVIDVSGIELHAVALTAALHEVGETVKIRIPPERVVFLAGDQDVDVEVRKVLEPFKDGQPSVSRI